MHANTAIQVDAATKYDPGLATIIFAGGLPHGVMLPNRRCSWLPDALDLWVACISLYWYSSVFE